MQRLILFLPVIFFVILAVFLYDSIDMVEDDNSSKATSNISISFPEFQLVKLGSEDITLTRDNIVGQIALVNIWATWCISCRVEHPYLVKISKENNIPIYGVNWKDKIDDALSWLKKYGNPYETSVYDPNGELAINLGVTGAPETYLIDAKGQIVYKHLGIVNEQVWQDRLKPLIDQLQQQVH